MPARQKLAALAGAAFATATLVYCGADTAANADPDAGMSASTRVFEAPCDKTRKGQLDREELLAEVVVPGLDRNGALGVSALRCDLTFAEGEDRCGRYPDACTGYAAPAVLCEPTDWYLADGKVVVRCAGGLDRRQGTPARAVVRLTP